MSFTLKKNISDSVLGTLLDIKGKIDSLNSQLDLAVMAIKAALHPIKIGDKYMLPLARSTLSSVEKSQLF